MVIYAMIGALFSVRLLNLILKNGLHSDLRSMNPALASMLLAILVFLAGLLWPYTLVRILLGKVPAY